MEKRKKERVAHIGPFDPPRVATTNVWGCVRPRMKEMIDRPIRRGGHLFLSIHYYLANKTTAHRWSDWAACACGASIVSTQSIPHRTHTPTTDTRSPPSMTTTRLPNTTTYTHKYQREGWRPAPVSSRWCVTTSSPLCCCGWRAPVRFCRIEWEGEAGDDALVCVWVGCICICRRVCVGKEGGGGKRRLGALCASRRT